MSELIRTPLYERHVALGARIVDFAGFAMPVQYESILSEHAAVRERAGLFDVSHMGQIHVEGPRAVECVEQLVSCRVASLKAGRVRYGLLCNETGGVVDDVTVYRLGENALLLCVNAANIQKDREWIEAQCAGRAEVRDRSDETGLLALQGPESAAILADLGGDVEALGRFAFAQLELGGVSALVSRTGYTGSDGFEIYLPADRAASLFDGLIEKGSARGLRPAGLGARDTLRLEAALPLYGHELDDDTSPLEAGLERFVKRREGGFIGAEAIETRERAGRSRQLVGFQIEGRGIARAGHGIQAAGHEVGRVTSGAPSPTLGKSIGLGYVPPEHAAPGGALEVEIRGRGVPVRIVETPFVSARPKRTS